MRAHTAAPYSTQCTRHQLTPHPLPHPDVCPAAVRIWERTQMVRLERAPYLHVTHRLAQQDILRSGGILRWMSTVTSISCVTAARAVGSSSTPIRLIQTPWQPSITDQVGCDAPTAGCQWSPPVISGCHGQAGENQPNGKLFNGC